jgi:hypothetical protein
MKKNGERDDGIFTITVDGIFSVNGDQREVPMPAPEPPRRIAGRTTTERAEFFSAFFSAARMSLDRATFEGLCAAARELLAEPDENDWRASKF